MAKTKQEQANVGVATEIQNFSPTEMEIYDLFQEKGFAVAHIDEHRNLWEWSQKNNCGVYIGRRRIPTDSGAGNANNKWANPYKLDGRFGGDGKRDKVILSFYQHISNKVSLHEKLEKELKDKILFCHCRKNIKNNKTNRCHGDILAALANNRLPFIDTNLSTGSAEFNKLYEDFTPKQIEKLVNPYNQKFQYRPRKQYKPEELIKKQVKACADSVKKSTKEELKKLVVDNIGILQSKERSLGVLSPDRIDLIGKGLNVSDKKVKNKLALESRYFQSVILRVELFKICKFIHLEFGSIQSNQFPKIYYEESLLFTLKVIKLVSNQIE